MENTIHAPRQRKFTRDEYIGVWYVGYVDNTVEDVVKVIRKSDRARNKKKLTMWQRRSDEVAV